MQGLDLHQGILLPNAEQYLASQNNATQTRDFDKYVSDKTFIQSLKKSILQASKSLSHARELSTQYGLLVDDLSRKWHSMIHSQKS